MLQREWRLPARKLILAMPITCVLIAFVTHAVTDLYVDRVVPARRAALADRSRAVLERGDQPARAAARAPLAQPRVGYERRPRAARRARLQRRAGGRGGRLRLVRVRAPGRHARLRLRDRDGLSGLVADAARGRGHPGAPQVAVRARRRVRDLRRGGARAGARQRLHRRVRVRDRARHPPARSRPPLRGARRRHRRDRQARHLRRLRRAADLRRPVRGRLGGRRHRRLHAVVRAHDRDLDLAGRHEDRHRHQGVHGVVRPQGRGDDDVLDPRPRSADRRGRAHLQPRRPRGLLLDHRPRAERHARVGVARYSAR